jgi:diguanylate cyclase (GGDEF)-like protein
MILLNIMFTLTPKRTIIVAGILLACHACCIAGFGTSPWGAVLSDSLQVSLGLLVICAAVQASCRSGSLGRYFWRIAAFSFCIWLAGQVIAVYCDIAALHDSFPTYLEAPMKILFALWFVPLGVAIFLSADRDLKEFDGLLIIDFLQAAGLVLVSYLFFFYIPSRSGSDGDTHYISQTVVDRYFLVHSALTAAFFLRYLYDRSPSRTLFRDIGGFLFVSSILDFLAYETPARNLPTGSWFDILWSSILLIPLIAAARWKETAQRALPSGRVPAPAMIVTQIFPLFYPLLILALSARVAQNLIVPAALVVLLSYGCTTLRMILTHKRLLTAQRALEHQATHDGLTGVFNRTAILDLLERELPRAERGGTSVGVIMVDADHFKQFNDRYGHATGDAVLRKLSSIMEAGVRPYDFVGRMGGEEFLIVTPECSLEETRVLAERIRKQIEECRMMAGEAVISFTVSMGVTAGYVGCDVRSVLNAADTALYSAKNSGRNRVQSEAARPAEAVADAPAVKIFPDKRDLDATRLSIGLPGSRH